MTSQSSVTGRIGPLSVECPHMASIAPILLTPDEAADLCRVTRATVYRWARDGIIPAVHVGGSRGSLRIPRAALEQHLTPEHTGSPSP